MMAVRIGACRLDQRAFSVAKLAPALEERGIDSLWTGGRTHLSIRIRYPAAPDLDELSGSRFEFGVGYGWNRH